MLLLYAVIVLAVLGVAYANGANDNFKGVATLLGSGTTTFHRALLWATVTTGLGSVTALLLAAQLMVRFSGKGLVASDIAEQPAFAAAVALGAGLTVLLATRLGMPISTTHSLVGALLGAGSVAGAGVNVGILGSKFMLPLLLSPVLAIVATSATYPLLRYMRQRLGITRDICVCVGTETVETFSSEQMVVALQRARHLTATLSETASCQSRYEGDVLGVSAGDTLDKGHFLSAGIVSFARGLNDTPKIAAMLMVAPLFGASVSLVLVAVAIAVGGLISARRVAVTMSRRITTMNHGQGFTANVVTGAIVISASCWGLPVSTTHVSCGSLFGIGTVTGQANKKTILTILLAWITTLPVAAFLAGGCYWVLRQM